MTRSAILVLITCGLLSACADLALTPPPAPVPGGNYSHSVGFTGVGPELF